LLFYIMNSNIKVNIQDPPLNYGRRV